MVNDVERYCRAGGNICWPFLRTRTCARPAGNMGDFQPERFHHGMTYMDRCQVLSCCVVALLLLFFCCRVVGAVPLLVLVGARCQLLPGTLLPLLLLAML